MPKLVIEVDFNAQGQLEEVKQKITDSVESVVDEYLNTEGSATAGPINVSWEVTNGDASPHESELDPNTGAFSEAGNEASGTEGATS
jgi:hypothetical protein